MVTTGFMEKIFNYFCVNAKEYSQIQIGSIYVKVHQHNTGAKKKDWAVNREITKSVYNQNACSNR